MKNDLDLLEKWASGATDYWQLPFLVVTKKRKWTEVEGGSTCW